MRFALVKKGRGSNLYVSACDYWVCRGAKSWKIGLLPPTRSSCSFCVSLPHATREKCTDARPYFVSHVLLSWQNGQSTAEDGVTPAVKVATHTAPHTHTHTRTDTQNGSRRLFLPAAETKFKGEIIFQSKEFLQQSRCTCTTV